MIRTKSFQRMVNLRLLQINHVLLRGDFKNIPADLKWLQWKGCPLKTLPPTFCPQKLAVLDLSESVIERLLGFHSKKVYYCSKAHFNYCFVRSFALLLSYLWQL